MTVAKPTGPTSSGGSAFVVSRVAPGIYRASSGALYERPTIGGRRTWRRLAARTLATARLEVARRRSDQALSRRGLAADPYRPGGGVADLLEAFREAGCPDRRGRSRAGRALALELRRLDRLGERLGRLEAQAVTLADLRAYRDARGGKDRAVDLELGTLAAAFRFAEATGRIARNPLERLRTRFRAPDQVRHARDRQPASGAEVHRLARVLFGSARSEAVAWLLLLAAMTGRRVGELLELRIDAKDPREAGFRDRATLYFRGRRSHKGVAGFIRCGPLLAEALAVHRTWLEARFPGCPWFFPGRDGRRPLARDSLTRALRRAAARLDLPARSAHGLRSFYVNVRRSQGATDSAIALEVGHKGGERLILEVYGEALPIRLSWSPGPGSRPAWSALGIEAPAVAVYVKSFPNRVAAV